MPACGIGLQLIVRIAVVFVVALFSQQAMADTQARFCNGCVCPPESGFIKPEAVSAL